MARNYAALPHEYLEEMDTLSDAEFGRLCRALLRYSMDGREGQLQGAEKVVWKRVKMQEDRFQESYKELTNSRREAGKKGAAKRWHSMASDGKAMASDGKNAYTETKTETNIPPPIGGRDTHAREAAPAVSAQSDFLGCAARSAPFRPADPKIAAVFSAYTEKIGGKSPLTKRIQDKLLFFLGTMGPECCIRAMDEAVEMGKISWRYVEKVLESKMAQGVKCLADWEVVEKNRPGGQAKPRDLQPTAERIQKNNDWLDAFLAEQKGRD